MKSTCGICHFDLAYVIHHSDLESLSCSMYYVFFIQLSVDGEPNWFYLHSWEMTITGYFWGMLEFFVYPELSLVSERFSGV